MDSLNGDWPVFGVGCLGGLLTEFLHWYNLRTSGKLPVYAWSKSYWGLTAGMILVGGLLALVQLGPQSPVNVALQLGAAAPFVIQKIASAAGATGAKGVGTASVSDFFRW